MSDVRHSEAVAVFFETARAALETFDRAGKSRERPECKCDYCTGLRLLRAVINGCSTVLDAEKAQADWQRMIDAEKAQTSRDG